jgi:hypothetical protein
MENNFFQKAKLATAIALVSSTTLLTGCLVDGNKANSLTTSSTSAAIGNNGVTTTAPKGTIQGIVQDTNGNPISGATVYIGARSVTTTAGGTYEMADVAVSGIEITGDNDYLGGSVRVVIVPPAGYLGATVDVTTSAIIDQGRSDQGTTEETGTAQTNRFVDGFTAVAGDAVLPAIGENGATVTGVLRDNVTNEAIVNQTVNLELKSVNGGDHTTGSNAISYTTLSYQVTTDATGNFTITGAPNDSDLTFVVGGYTVNSVDANVFNTTGVLTNDEVERVHVGNVYVTEIPNDDNANPFVIAIEEAATNGARAKLNDDVTNVLTVHFSEAIQTSLVDTITTPSGNNSVVVRDLTAGQYLTVDVAVAADARSMTLTGSVDFVAGNEIDIYLLKVDFRDIANNMLDEDSDVTSNDISYDYDDVNGNGDFLKLQVEVFRNLLQDAAVVTGLAQLTADDSPERVAGDAEGFSDAFADVDMQSTVNGTQQLNSADNDSGPTNDADERLSNLIAALDLAGVVENSGVVELNADGTPVTANLGLNTGVETDIARVQFTPSNAAFYRYWIMRDATVVNTNPTIDAVSSPDAENVSTASNFTTAAAASGYGVIRTKTGSNFADFASSNVAFLIDDVEPGDIFYIQSMDEFGNEGSTTQVTLADNVPVTTGLQDAYGELDLQSSSTVFGQQYGNGAELANPDFQVLVGLPLLNVNSGMLADQGNIVDAAPDLSNLYDENFADAANNNQPYITAASLIYDKTAYAAWSLDMSRTIAVSFTEDLAWTTPLATDATKPAATANEPTYTGTTAAALTGWTIMNDVTIASDADTVNADLVAIDVDNIFTLANTDGQVATVIDFTNQIEDNAGNTAVATTNAKVVVNDAMPPMVTEAVYNGSNLTVTFNEAVQVNPDAGNTVVTLGGINIDMDVDSRAAHNAKTTSKNVLVIPFTTDNADDLLPLNRTGIFTLGDYDEAGLASAAADAGGHAILTFPNVQDAFGNSWAEDDTNLTTPRFAAYDNLGQLVGTPSPSALPTGAGLAVDIVINYTFTHAIDIDAMLGQAFGTIDENTNITGAQVASIMTLTGATTIDAGNTSASISANGKVLTINLRTAANLSSADSLDFNASVPSRWDSIDAVNVSAIVAP